jgi:outer membrane receptor protein involved in Fe transport
MTGRRDRATGRIWGLTNRSGERNQEERKQVRGSVSWFRPNWAGGDHELKLGTDFFIVPANRVLKDRAEHGGVNYRLNYREGVSDRIEILNAPVSPDNAGRYFALYLSDQWTVGRRLTLNLGVRYARDSIYEKAGCRQAAPPPAHIAFPDTCWEKTQMPIFNSVVPRLRASYDLTGDGRTTLKGGWGRYVRMRLFDHLQPMANNVISTAVYRWRDRNGDDEYTPGEIDLDLNGDDFLSLSLSGTFEGAGRGVVNPDEKQAYTDEFSVQLERELIPNLAVRVLGLQARVRDVVRLANRLRPYEAYNIPITSTDPGPDGRVGTGDDPGSTITWYDYPEDLAGFAFQQAIYVNDAKANQKYTSFEVAISKRLSNNWQFQAAHTSTKRNVPLLANEDEFNTLDPNAEIFPEDTTWEWLTRLSGSYLFPYGILASARFEHRSGAPWARTALLSGGEQIPDIEVRVEPWGTRRLDHINLLSVRGEKQFRVMNGHQLQLRASLNNILNTTVATSVVSLSGSSFGRLTGQVLPRVIVFEAEYQF